MLKLLPGRCDTLKHHHVLSHIKENQSWLAFIFPTFWSAQTHKKQQILTHTNKLHPRFSHLFMPVLPEPHHLVHDALQRGEQRGMQLPLHVHDPAAAPHGGGGPDGPWVRGPGMRLCPDWAGLLLSRCIWPESRKNAGLSGSVQHTGGGWNWICNTSS